MNKKRLIMLIVLIFVCTVIIRAFISPNNIQVEQSAKKDTSALQQFLGGEGSAGIRKVQATSVIYSSSSPMIDSIVIEYSEEIILPDKPINSLYSFADAKAGNKQRTVKAIYTNDKPQVREDEESISGRYVIVQLVPVENPDLESGIAWRADNRAGMTVLWDSSHSVLRMDYSGVTIQQNFDAENESGQVIQPAGQLPKLQYEDVSWPQLEGFFIDNVLKGEEGDIHYSFYLPDDYDPSKRYPMMVTLTRRTGHDRGRAAEGDVR